MPESGRFICTSGIEGKAYAYPTDKPLAAEHAGSQRIHRGGVLAMDMAAGRLATASSDCSAVTYDLGAEGFGASRMATRGNLPARAVALHPSRPVLAVGDEYGRVCGAAP